MNQYLAASSCAPGQTGRKKKDANAPKRAMTAFLFFSAAVREDVRRDNPGISLPEVGVGWGGGEGQLQASAKAGQQDTGQHAHHRSLH
jgi:hypothetical protein